MNKQEMLKEIYNMRLTRVFALITFRSENLEDDPLFFQWFGSSRIRLKDFVNYNFKDYSIKNVLRIERSPINKDCVIVYVRRYYE